jgi:hypothetical protein
MKAYQHSTGHHIHLISTLSNTSGQHLTNKPELKEMGQSEEHASPYYRLFEKHGKLLGKKL